MTQAIPPLFVKEAAFSSSFSGKSLFREGVRCACDRLRKI